MLRCVRLRFDKAKKKRESVDGGGLRKVANAGRDWLAQDRGVPPGQMPYGGACAGVGGTIVRGVCAYACCIGTYAGWLAYS